MLRKLELELVGMVICLVVAVGIIAWQANEVFNAPCPQGQGQVKVQVRTMQGPAVACIPSR